MNILLSGCDAVRVSDSQGFLACVCGVVPAVLTRINTSTPSFLLVVVLVLLLLITFFSFAIIITPHLPDMDFKGKVAMFPYDKTTVDIIDIATGKVVQQHDVEGRLGYSAFMQKNIIAMAVSTPHPGVHVMDLESGVLLCKFILPNGRDARVTLSRDAVTLAVGTSIGLP